MVRVGGQKDKHDRCGIRRRLRRVGHDATRALGTTYNIPKS